MYVLLNPHISDFISEPLAFKFIKRRPLKKYDYLISAAVRKYGKADVLVNSAVSGIIPTSIFKHIPYFLRLIISGIEIYFWKKRNKFKNEVAVHYKSNRLDPEVPLVLFAYKNYKSGKRLLNTCKYFKTNIVHLSHYHLETGKLSILLRQINNVKLAADTDISTSVLFKSFFAWYEAKILLLQFAIGGRFSLIKPFETRTKKIISTGTFHNFKNNEGIILNDLVKDFVGVTGASALHPLRKEIYEKRNLYAGEIDCYNSEYIEQSKNLFQKIIPKRLFAGQKAYFSFDIVKEYNEHAFALVGEEYFSGLPGIGAFEAIACGCILFGSPDCYKGLDMEVGKDYLPHHNNLEEVLSSVKEYSLEELKDMSDRSAKKISAYFSADQIFERFENQLKLI